MNQDHAPMGLGEERVPASEAAAIEQITAATWEMLDVRKRPVQRAQHAKHHGCVTAEFIVEPDVPAHLRHGVLKTPRSYQALVRFSNGGKKDDRQRDAHGMAVKLLDAGGGGQDFVMVDHPVFFIRNAADYVVFVSALRAAQSSAPARLMSFSAAAVGIVTLLGLLWGFFARGRWHELGIFLKFVAKQPASPLASQYWSTTPYRLGPHAIRFSARPQETCASAGDVETKSPDFLREALSAHLNLGKREARFDFLVQVQTDAAAMPVEDPTIAWDESISPYRKVATLHIPPQSFESPAQMEACENLSFSPWHTLPEHHPLGGINRARERVYAVMSQRRHELNGASARKPGN
jgi:catalase